MSLSNARKALVAAYKTAFPTTSTAYENIPLDVPSAPWVKFTFMPAGVEVVTLGNAGEDEHTGVLQLDWNGTLGTGDADAASFYASARAAFTAGQIITHSGSGQQVRVWSCERTVGRVVDGFYRVSVNIRWTAREQRT
jgi:hypothetical protein